MTLRPTYVIKRNPDTKRWTVYLDRPGKLLLDHIGGSYRSAKHASVTARLLAGREADVMIDKS